MNKAIIHAKDLDEATVVQIQELEKHPVFNKIVMMPDAHAGAGCPIGFTGYMRGGVVPNVVGVDIGCGVTMSYIAQRSLFCKDNLSLLDNYIRLNIPMGMDRHANECKIAGVVSSYCDNIVPDPNHLLEEVKSFYVSNKFQRYIDPLLQLGTVGGGNHFIELVLDPAGSVYQLIHSGSRNFGKQVADYYQKIAIDECTDTNVSKGLAYLKKGTTAYHDYMYFANIATKYAYLNRAIIMRLVAAFFGNQDASIFMESIHNYIDGDLVRKGAISAKEKERVVIPLNMAEGVIVGRGRGNSDYNFSAPHGAGRRHGRKEMKKMLEDGSITMKEYKDRMKDIFSTSICPATIDESPMAYKNTKDVSSFIKETVDIDFHATPIYNIKSAELSPQDMRKLKKHAARRARKGLDSSELLS